MPTLYISREDGILGRNGNALHWRARSGESPQTLPLNQVDGVVVLGQGNVTTPALHLLMDANIPVHYVDSGGRYKGYLSSGRGRGYILRRRQYDAANKPDECVTLARRFVFGKILGQRKTLLRWAYRSRRANPLWHDACTKLTHLSMFVLQREKLEDIRGVEGIAASKYFTILSGILSPPWTFRERTKRPPRDPVNALLSFGYALLLSSVTTAVIIAGLDPCVGFLHPEYRGRPSLALDMMEEFRSPVIDRMVVAACNQGLFKISDFSRSEENGGISMNASVKKMLLRLYDERLRTSVKNDRTGEYSTYENHIRARAAALAVHLREGREYLPFICGLKGAHP